MASLDLLLNVLRQASSQNAKEFQPAVQTLKDSESHPGFHYALLKIVLSSNDNVDVHTRWLGALYLKNGVERHWRSHSPSPIQNNEKESIRNEILQCVDEGVHQIAVQMAVIVSKIARFDYPRHWPSLFPTVLHQLSLVDPESNHPRNHTVLLVFKFLMKELSSKQLPGDRKIFCQISTSCFEQTFSLWARFHLTFCSCLNATTTNNSDALLRNTIILLKAFRCMWSGFDPDHKQTFVAAVLENTKKLLNILFSVQLSKENLSVFHKLLIVLSKILRDLAESDDCLKYAQQLAGLSQECIYAYAKNRECFEERFIVNCMIQVKLVATLSASTENKVISLEDIQQLLRCIVFSFLSLSKEDLEKWEDDAEEFCSEEIGETWIYNIRPSAEVLFLTLLHCDPQHLVPVILSTLENVNEQSVNDATSSSLESILTSDAVYAAVGLAANELFDSLNFEQWFTNRLLPSVKQYQGHRYGKIIHRRVLWLIDQWTAVKPANENRTLMYDFITASMDASMDMAVRLSASSALRQVLDDFEFDIGTFAPYQERCTDALHTLLQNVESGDAKMRVLFVLSFVIERLGTQVSSFINKLAQVLPALWLESESHNMLRCAVLSTLVNVVNGLREQSVNLYPLLLNVIHASTDSSSPALVYLLPDGLDLWISVMHNATSLSSELLQLFGNLFELLELSSESLKECFHIVECYVVLDGSTLMKSQYAPALAQSIRSLITDVRDECLTIVTRLVARMVQVVPSETATIFQDYLRSTMQVILQGDEPGILATSRIVLVARLALHNFEGFWSILEACAESRLEEAVDVLTRVFSDKLDCVVESELRKVVAVICLAIANRVSTVACLSAVLPRVICITVQVLHDVCDEEGIDTTVITHNAASVPVTDEWEHLHSIRLNALMLSDPTHKIALPNYTRDQLEIVKSRFESAESFQQFLTSSVENEVLRELQEFLCRLS